MPKNTTASSAKNKEKLETLKQLRSLTHTLDNAFEIPVIGYRVGWDAIIGLVPGIGDAIMLVPSGYIVYQAYRLGAPRRTLVRMGVNLGLETLIGSVPLVGDLFDATWKSNARNLHLLEQHLGPTDEAVFEKPSNKGPLLFLLGALAILGGGIVLVVWLLVWLFQRINLPSV